MTPTVTVVIPAFQAGRYLAESIGSVLGQTWTDLECLVVDDGSTDDTPDVLAAIDDPRVRVLRQENLGVAHARNRGIQAAQGRYIALLDADDIWMPTKLERQLAVFEAGPEIGFVSCSYLVVGEHGEVVTFVPGPDRRALMRWMMLEGDGAAFASTAMIDRAALERIGGFDPSLSNSADLDLAARIAARLAIGVVPEPLAQYRLHTQQMHRDLGLFQRDYERVIELHLTGRHRRRGVANLHVRAGLLRLAGGEIAVGLRHLARAFRASPSRLVLLPLNVAGRRLVRRARARRAQRWSTRGAAPR